MKEVRELYNKLSEAETAYKSFVETHKQEIEQEIRERLNLKPEDEVRIFCDNTLNAYIKKDGKSTWAYYWECCDEWKLQN